LVAPVNFIPVNFIIKFLKVFLSVFYIATLGASAFLKKILGKIKAKL